MAFALLHERLMRHRTEREQLKIEVEMGMPGAQARYQALIDESYADLEQQLGGGR